MPIFVDSSDVYDSGPNWIKYTNGIAVAWAVVSVVNASQTTWNYPISFAEAPQVYATPGRPSGGPVIIVNLDGLPGLASANITIYEWDDVNKAFITPSTADAYLYASGRWIAQSGGGF